MSIHGTSKYLSHGVTLLAEAEFQDFAPCPCICLACCTNSAQQARTYFQVWDNRIEWNSPCPLFGCITCSELCVVDCVGAVYFDRPPMRSGMCCFCLPFTICGPPVISNKIPSCFCIDLSSCFGEQLVHAPGNCNNCKCFICFGPYCYECWSCPIVGGLKNSGTFAASFSAAVNAYMKLHHLPDAEMAVFDVILGTNESSTYPTS